MKLRLLQLLRLSPYIFFLNVLSQHVQPQHLGPFEDSDHHQAYYMLSDLREWPEENGVTSFQTYGPLYRAINTKVAPSGSQPHYWTKFVGLCLHLLPLFFFLRCSEIPFRHLTVSVFFAIFNFVPIWETPLILLLWALGYRHGDSRPLKVAHLLTGVMITSLYALYKPSLAIACFLLLAAAALSLRGFHNWKGRLRWFTFHGLLTATVSFGLYLLFTSGNLYTFITYIRVAIEDAATYPQWNLSPLEWNNRTTQFFPLLMLLCLSGLACLKMEGRRGWVALLVFPLIFVDAKHAYVRADITNIGSIFAFFPLVLAILLARFWSQARLRLVLGGMLLGCIILAYVGKVPYNTPYRHPRLLWLTGPEAYARKFAEKQKQSQAAFESYLGDFHWCGEKVADKSLLSIPAHIGISKLGQPWLLPSNQNLYCSSHSLRARLDLQAIRSSPPEFILYQNRLLDFLPPMSNRLDFYLEMLENYRVVAQDRDFFLFERSPAWAKIEYVELGSFRLDQGKGVFRFELPDSALLFAKTSGLITPGYKLRSLLLKGDRLVHSLHRPGEVSSDKLCSFPQLELGFMTPLDMDALAKSQTVSSTWIVEFKGSLMEKFPHDPVNALGGKPSRVQLDLGYYLLRSSNPENTP